MLTNRSVRQAMGLKRRHAISVTNSCSWRPGAVEPVSLRLLTRLMIRQKRFCTELFGVLV